MPEYSGLAFIVGFMFSTHEQMYIIGLQTSFYHTNGGMYGIILTIAVHQQLYVQTT